MNPRYSLGQRIGVGGMAEVFLARRESPEGASLCAVKKLRPELLNDAEFKRRLLDEASITRRLHHPCIVEVFDTYEQDGTLHLVMEYVDGVALEHLIIRGLGGLLIPVTLSAFIVSEIAHALDFAHHEGVLHRDVSASNVLISAAGDVKLADFGLADGAGRVSVTAPGQILGKWTYLSKRRREGHPAVARDDLYALGILAGRLLAAGDPRDRSGTAGRRLQALVTRMTADEQPLHAREIVETLGDFERAEVSRKLAAFLSQPLPARRRHSGSTHADLLGSTEVPAPGKRK